MNESLIFSPTSNPRIFRSADGKSVSPPETWSCLPPGDAGMTRRVKAAGPSWQVIEQRGRKKFSRGLWAPAENIAAAQAALDSERATPAYAKKRVSDLRRREVKQENYVGEFVLAVLQFLDFTPSHSAIALKLAERVVAHATPVGSGTVARTETIPIEERAEAAVIAWMRHQTTEYDNLSIKRIKGARREVRRKLAGMSRQVLDSHRGRDSHVEEACPLCQALKQS